MTTYSGNPVLAPDVQKRIVEAFRHAVESAAGGSSQEALLGCDFVLRIDPTFEAARTLQQMVAQQRTPEAIRGLLSALGDKPAASAVPSFTAAAPGLVATFSRLFEARRFEELLSAAQSQAAAVAGDPKLRELVAQAQSRYESEPFVREQLDLARRALGAGRLDEVAGAVARARELDASHPGLAEIERLSASASSMSNSLKIDWDEEDRAMPPPADLLPPAGSPAPPAPSAVAPPVPVAPAVIDFDLPDIDFASEGSFFAPTEGAADAAADDPTTRPGTPLAAADEAAPLLGADDLALPEFDAPAVSFGGGGARTTELEESRDEAEGRVQSLLDEGEAAFASQDFQGAIDAWSRIFLIDIDNEEAARRIERARQLKAEQERAVEEVFHDGVARFDAGEWEAAREAFRRVLAEQPSYVLAREYLDKLEERAASGAAPSGLPEMAPLPSLGAPARREEGEPAVRRRAGGEEILVPPEPGDRRETRQPVIEGFAAKKKKGIRLTPAFLAIGGTVLVALGVGGWFLTSNWSRLFPNAPAPAAAAPSDAASMVARAKKLHEEGQTAVAIAQLRRIPPQDASYAEAQSLVSQWEKLVEKPAAADLSPDLERRRSELVRQAAAAVAGGEHFVARRLLAEAATLAPLAGEAADLSAIVEQRAAAYAEELALLRDGDFERALNRLWRRHEADPADKDLRRLMVDSYYNLSLADLQRGDPRSARTKLREARNFDKSDPMLERLERFCAVYEKREQDLLYRIFVKYLPPR